MRALIGCTLAAAFVLVSCGRSPLSIHHRAYDYSALDDPIDPDFRELSLAGASVPQEFDLSAQKGEKARDDKFGSLFFTKNIEFSLPASLQVRSGAFKPKATAKMSFINIGDLSELKKFLEQAQEDPAVLQNIRAYSCEYKLAASGKEFAFDHCDGKGAQLAAGNAMLANLLFLSISSSSKAVATAVVGTKIARISEEDHEGLTAQQAAALDTIPSSTRTAKDGVVLPGGSIYQPSPVQFSLDVAPASGRLFDIRNKISLMVADAFRLVAAINFPAQGGNPAQSKIAYGLGLKEYTQRRSPTQGVCSQAIHGLDCSGFVGHLANFAGIKINVQSQGAAAQGQPATWNALFAPAQGIKAVSVATTAAFETGDIVGWGGHIGFVMRYADGDVNIIQSNGAASTSADCIRNLGPNRGPRGVRLSVITAAGFMGPIKSRLRFQSIPTIAKVSEAFDVLGGGKRVELQGNGFTDRMKVFFGAVEVPQADITRASEFSVFVKVPRAAKTGKVQLKAINFIDNSPISDVPSVDNVSFEYRGTVTQIIDISAAASDSLALADLINDSNNVDPTPVEPGKPLYLEGSGLGGAQFVVPGVTQRLSASAVNLPTDHPLYVAGAEVWKLTIPSSAVAGSTGMIRAIITIDGVEQSFESPRNVKISGSGSMYKISNQFKYTGRPGVCPEGQIEFGTVSKLEILSGPLTGGSYEKFLASSCVLLETGIPGQYFRNFDLGFGEFGPTYGYGNMGETFPGARPDGQEFRGAVSSYEEVFMENGKCFSKTTTQRTLAETRAHCSPFSEPDGTPAFCYDVDESGNRIAFTGWSRWTYLGPSWSQSNGQANPPTVSEASCSQANDVINSYVNQGNRTTN
jgi:hypothetical protein